MKSGASEGIASGGAGSRRAFTIPVTTTGSRDEIILEAEAAGMDPQRILEHRERLRVAQNSGRSSNLFEISDTCRISNGRLFLLDHLEKAAPTGSLTPPEGYGAFVPAAGAASRYMAILEPLRSALESGNQQTARVAWKRLKDYHPLMPGGLVRAFSGQQQNGEDIPDKSLRSLFNSPKALLPCTPGGQSFLVRKAREHSYFSCLEAQFFIVPPGMKERFLEHLADDPGPEVYCYEQGPSCSTFRFYPDGRLVRDLQGQPSEVPAGHGSLLNLFPGIRRGHPEISALFIRNIDNVSPMNPESQSLSRRFLSVHQRIMATIKTIRDGLGGGMSSYLFAPPGEEVWLLKLPGIRPPDQEQEVFLKELPGLRERNLWEILFRVFLTPAWCRGDGKVQDLQRLYNRPVNLMGQIRNRGKDRGGSPVVIRAAAGELSICLERPHASSADQKEILDCPEKSTHFNPVFVAAELSDYPGFQDHRTPFWLLAEKTWHGQPVIYYETVLYELLGNTMTTNCLFAEVPGFIFNPRKTIRDALGTVSGY